MAYNYSRAYLMANEDMLRKLIQLADTDQQGEAPFDDPGKAQAFQFKVNNLLASLAVNHPGRAYVRRKVRTWIAGRGDKTIVVVGVPTPGLTLRGAKPNPIELRPVETAGVLTVQEEITASNWPAIGIKLVKAKSSNETVRIVFIHPPDQGGIEYIAEKLAPEFQVMHTQPTMVLERVAAARPIIPRGDT